MRIGRRCHAVLPSQCDLARGRCIIWRGNAAEPALTVSTHNLALNAAPVWRLTNRWQNGTDSIGQTGLGLRICIVQSRLDHVVCERIAKHLLELVRIEHLFDHNARYVRVSATETFLNDVGAEFLFRQGWYTALEDVAQWIRKGRFGKVNDILQYVVAESILHQSKSIGGDLTDELSFLVARGMIDTSLQNAASMAMGSNNHAVVANCIEYELCTVLASCHNVNEHH